ncbi:MAG: nucleoside monophosphate kinase [bacterium]
MTTELVFKHVFEHEPVIVFIGQSCCGKGTTISFLKEDYKKITGKDLFISETGQLFRDEISKMSPRVSAMLHEKQVAGKRQNAYIASTLWMRKFLYEYSGGPMIIDGSPRSKMEAEVLVRFFTDFGKKIIVFHLQISEDEAKRRITLRGRNDSDTPEKIREKLFFYGVDVLPALRWLKEQVDTHTGSHIHFYEISGEKEPEKVYETIKDCLMYYHS